MVEEPGEALPQEAPPAPVKVGATVTPVAEAPPEVAVLRTLAVSVTAWPALTGEGGWAEKVTARPAAAWTMVAGEVVAEALSGRPVLAAVPVAVAVKVMEPAPEGVQVKL